MSLADTIRSFVSGGRAPFVTTRALLLLASPLLPFALVRAAWIWALAAVWLAAWTWLVARDVRESVRPSELALVRTFPPKLSMGVPNAVEVTVENLSARRAVLQLRETPPPGFAGERVLGRVEIAPRDTHVRKMSFTPPGRGAFAFGPMGVRSLGPLGLGGRLGTFGEPDEVRVYPDITAVHRYALLARRGAILELGLRRTRIRGKGTEFESLRDYQPGDTFRDVDWKATARRVKPVVRTYEVERSQTMVVAIDTGRLMTPVVEGMSKLDRAVNAALLLSYLGIEADDHVGLLVFGRDIETFLPPNKGRRRFSAILEALYSVEGRVEEPDYGRAFRYLASKLGKRALVVTFTDLAGAEASRRLLGVLGALTPRHLPLVVTQRNRFLERLASCEPDGELGVFEAAVAEGVLRDKASAVRSLIARGGLALDVYPEELSAATVDRYLDIKGRGAL